MNYAPDPERKWKRNEYDRSTLDGKSNRERAEIETDRDLDKCIEQLVCDVHEETHNSGRSDLGNIASAQKRMVSLMARVALSNDKMSNRILWLTVAITIMTFLMLIPIIPNLIVLFKK